MTPVGCQLSIRFLTCTDEGRYRIVNETFTLITKSDDNGKFYYIATVDEVKKAAFVSPLDGVIRISTLNIRPDSIQM